MYESHQDASVEINWSRARIHVLSSRARDWIEAHVTLEQVETWTGEVLDVAPHHIGDLIAGMLADGMKIATTHGVAIEERAQWSRAFFLSQVSLN